MFAGADLAVNIEGPDILQLIAYEIKTDWIGGIGWKDIDNTPPESISTRLGDQRYGLIPVVCQPAPQMRPGHLPGTNAEEVLLEQLSIATTFSSPGLRLLLLVSIT